MANIIRIPYMYNVRYLRYLGLGNDDRKSKYRPPVPFSPTVTPSVHVATSSIEISTKPWECIMDIYTNILGAK